MNKKDRVLKLFGLDIHFTDGAGDYLYYQENDREVRILDVAGSYGINLLGHKNPVVKEIAEQIGNFPPNFIQGSKNPEKENLLDNLLNRIETHTGKKNWQCELANTGTEIIELALKICLKKWENRKIEWQQEKTWTLNFMAEEKQEVCQEIEASYSFLQNEPLVIHLKGSFHGKTLGALSVMSNSLYKKGFSTAITGIEILSTEEALENLISKHIKTYFYYNPKTGQLQQKSCCPISALIIEPIQGEGGVIKLSAQFIKALAAVQKKWRIPVISDEIQCGLYRTGTFSALSPEMLTSDIYCFGKALGAGIAKISALCYRSAFFDDNVYTFHTSSFSEDYLGCFAANRFLKFIEDEKPVIFPLADQLRYFALSYPDLIKEARGEGLMTAIELNEELFHTSFITKFFKDLHKLGYWISSVLLSREQIRIFPTLTATLTFRIQPSVQFNENDFEHLTGGLSRFFKAIKEENLQYLFGHLVPLTRSEQLNPLPHDVQHHHFPPEAAVFICHPIDLGHFSHIVDLVDGFEEELLDQIIDEVREEQTFTIYHTDVIRNNSGEELNIVFLGIPLTSMSFYKALRQGKKHEWIEKIQEAINWANENGARSIGLGQYTSIISNNGMYLKSQSATLTTGNAYTASLALQAVRNEMKEKSLSDPEICIIGAAGNIASVIAEMLAAQSSQMTLIYHQKPENSITTQEQIIAFLTKIAEDKKIKSKVENLQLLISGKNNFMEITEAVSTVFRFTSDIDAASTADVIVIGTNQPCAVLYSKHVKPGTIVLDISVPPNASEDLICRDDITYIKGGVASLPLFEENEQALESVILPFGSGECFACMAETFGLGFANIRDRRFTGDLTRQSVEEITRVIELQGFALGRKKTERSL